MQKFTFGTFLGLLGLLGLPTAILAQTQSQTCEIQPGRESELSCALIYEIKRNVRLTSSERGIDQLLESGKKEPMFSDEVLETEADSQAELQFNDGSLAWTKPRTTFEFTPGLRQIQLVQGAILVIGRPGSETPNTLTAEAKVKPSGTIYLVSRNREKETTEVFVFSSAGGATTVVHPQTGESAEVKPGQYLAATREGLGKPQCFNVKIWLENDDSLAPLRSELGETSPQQPATVQETLEAVSPELLQAIEKQSLDSGKKLPSNESK